MNFPAELAAAITEGSSITIGTYISCPFILKFNPSPMGKDIFPTQFSTMISAFYNSNPPYKFSSELKSASIFFN